MTRSSAVPPGTGGVAPAVPGPSSTGVGGSGAAGGSAGGRLLVSVPSMGRNGAGPPQPVQQQLQPPGSPTGNGNGNGGGGGAASGNNTQRTGEGGRGPRSAEDFAGKVVVQSAILP
jgi:hypothetical protein